MKSYHFCQYTAIFLFRGKFFKRRGRLWAEAQQTEGSKLLFQTTNIHLSSDECQANLINIIPGWKNSACCALLTSWCNHLSPTDSATRQKDHQRPQLAWWTSQNPTQQHNYVTSGRGEASARRKFNCALHHAARFPLIGRVAQQRKVLTRHKHHEMRLCRRLPDTFPLRIRSRNRMIQKFHNQRNNGREGGSWAGAPARWKRSLSAGCWRSLIPNCSTGLWQMAD